MNEMSDEFRAKLKVLSPEDRKAVMTGFTYRVGPPTGKAEYARDLEEAASIRRRNAGESQAQITALPWERSPKAKA